MHAKHVHPHGPSRLFTADRFLMFPAVSSSSTSISALGSKSLASDVSCTHQLLLQGIRMRLMPLVFLEVSVPSRADGNCHATLEF
jgi:hypothetical protein